MSTKTAKPTTYVRAAIRLAKTHRAVSPGQVAYAVHRRSRPSNMMAMEHAADDAIRESGLFRRSLSSFSEITIWEVR